MSEYLSKKALLEWLSKQKRYAQGMMDTAVNAELKRISAEIQSGAFDTDINETQRLRAALETQVESCRDHPEEKPLSASSHTWTQDGDTYFVSYVTYCPKCYRVIDADARL